MRLVTHPCVRLRPPASHHPTKWTAEHLLRRARFAIPNVAAAVLISTFEPIDMNRVTTRILAKNLHLKIDELSSYVSRLKELHMLIASDDEEYFRFAEFFRKWASYGWLASADYYVATYDYDFADYNHGGRKVDIDRMFRYSQSEADTNRARTFPKAIATYPLGAPVAERLPISIVDMLAGKISFRELTRDVLFHLLVMAFGKTGEFNLVSPGASPAIRRTSPSGGARHPTEGYVAVYSIPDLPQGWYHYCSVTGNLELFRSEVTEDELGRIFYGAWRRAPFKPRAVIFMTSIFSRNMYRYREPRTFRSVHMDVGHLVGSLLFYAHALGVSAFAHSALEEDAIEAILEANGLVEGAMFSVAIGNHTL